MITSDNFQQAVTTGVSLNCCKGLINAPYWFVYFQERENTMRLNPPTVFIFLISLILAVAAVATQQGLLNLPVPFTAPGFWLALAAYVILAIGNLVRGL